MWADVHRKKAVHEALFKPSTRRYLLVEYIALMDELGRMIGCAPPSLRQFARITFWTIYRRVELRYFHYYHVREIRNIF